MLKTRIASLLQAEVVRRLARNASSLFGASMFSSLLGLFAFALVARSLGADAFGVFALVLAYVFVLDTAVNFQSWQAIIKFGAERLGDEHRGKFAALVKFGTLLDLGCACAGTMLAIVLTPALVPLFGPEVDARMFALYSVVILSRTIGTSTAILRLFDRFDMLAMQQGAIGVLRICFVVLAYFKEADLCGFLTAWGLAEVLGNWVLIAAAWRELGQKGFKAREVLNSSARRALRDNYGLWSFIWTTNLHSSLKLGLREADVLVLGFVAGPKAAGLYKVVKQAESLASRTYAPLTQAIYPELAKAVSAGDRRAMLRLLGVASAFTASVASIMWLAFCLCGQVLLTWVLGYEFASAYVPGLIYLFGTVLSAATFGLQPAVLALGMPQRSLRVLLVSTIVYGIVFLTLVPYLEVIGAAMSYVVFYAVWTALMLRLVWTGIRGMGAMRGILAA